MRWLAALLLTLGLAACAPEPVPANPAFWQVEGPLGRKAWLFGTIHSLDKPAVWKSDKVARALGEADVIVVEVSQLDNAKAMDSAFAQLATTPDQPPLSERVDPDLRDELAGLVEKSGFEESRFGNIESWAAALMLARAGSGSLNARYGIDRALLEWAKEDGKRVVDLEGVDGQLRIFDALPEQSQRALLNSVVRDAGSMQTESGSLAEAWRKGDMQLIARETTRGILADPGIRAMLFTMRNEAWEDRLVQMMAEGEKPFVAVGAAHMAGPDGLPAMLEARGYTVTRIQ
ncbi:MAG: TraB/GumN family protein [Novosphingobium sp.]|nr:TraB/GumN family protein [Novosphingobium sp.]